MRSDSSRSAGLRAFGIVWLGQLVSILPTSMTQFGLTVFVYEKAGEAKATAMGLMQVSCITPYLLISTLAGVIVDRYNRKWIMMVSDLLACLTTVAILTLM